AQMIARAEALQKAEPTPAGEATVVELKARWHEANGEGDKAVALLRARLQRPGPDPKEVLLLVASLGRQQRFDEALRELDRIWRCPAEMAGGTSVALLRSGRPSEALLEQVAGRLLEAIRKEPKNANLRIQLGDVRDLQNDYEKAEQCYEEALRVGGNNRVVLNNLAWLLAQRTAKGEKALELINRAIAAYGPSGELLDTRAVVYLK